MLPTEKTGLAEKYNVALPRYTSYPTMPFWNVAAFNTNDWKQSIKQSFSESNAMEGMSLYIHLPFCKNLCTYCGCNTRITKNHAVEQPYIKALMLEWTMYLNLFEKKPLIREIHLGGGTPTFFSAAHLKILLYAILLNTEIHPDAHFSFEAHPANTSEEHLQVLYDLGFRRLSLGIQDFDLNVQRIINREQSFEQVQQVTLAARKIGYTSINFDLIYGLPLQTVTGLTRTIEMVSELMPDRIAFYSYAHVPWLKPGQRSFTEQHLPDAAAKKALHQTGRDLLNSFGYLEIGMDHFALPADELFTAMNNGKLYRNFMGYTDQHTQLLIGLGVSAISDSGYAFAQNVKTVEEYLELVANGKFPVFKGHLLTRDDLIIRKHVQNIMCKGKTSWNHHLEPCLSLFAGLERLEILANDGLIELNSRGLKVTSIGNGYLRNICMAIDARLWAQRPDTQLFSMAI
ncbi:oxygen-independent coproporphyrinogen III oxidase [Mucilaginibacter gilvus]|uniref:Coproporphyrinogen-III oxidase n=1 Tax=Mucilaginibacter gilvus TaxID=2305909 RepID=A0A3S3UZF0_9SPHI|nr:oxygen-independent coproporphyrinogen III oxidase [Mucilaginibacter gilvus]RWY54343.1 oxygen-independent coproporphyrinogen III oxidase [Mucilaginibacter gilvus]